MTRNTREPEPPLSCEVMTPRHPAMCLLSTFFPLYYPAVTATEWDLSFTFSLYCSVGECEKAEGAKKKDVNWPRAVSRLRLAIVTSRDLKATRPDWTDIVGIDG